MTALTHRNASDTELEAAARIAPHLPRLQDLALQLIVKAGAEGMTDAELAEASGVYLYSMAPRRVELRDQGLVEDSGQRRDNGTGTRRIVWVATPAGKAALA